VSKFLQPHPKFPQKTYGRASLAERRLLELLSESRELLL